jgi:hypothetical protein
MTFDATKRKVFNRGRAPDEFLQAMVDWAKCAPDELFTPNPNADIYAKVKAELGPWESIKHRKAVMLEVLRVLAGFESSWNWKEGVDTSRQGSDTAENSEAGAWQVSYNARFLAPELNAMVVKFGIRNGIEFQRAMKQNHELAMEFVALLLRHNTKHNGPLYKGRERDAIRPSLRGEEHSIYPWLSRESVLEFQSLI